LLRSEVIEELICTFTFMMRTYDKLKKN